MGRLLTTKELAAVAVFGGLAFAVRFLGLVLVVMPPLKLDARWVFSLLAAWLVGPLGGAIAGALAGLPAELPFIDVPAAIITHALVGYFCRNLRLRWKGILLWPVFGVPAWALLLVGFGFFPMEALPMICLAAAGIGIPNTLIAALVALAVEKRTEFYEAFAEQRR